MATIEYRYIGDFAGLGAYAKVRSAVNMLAWRLRDLSEEVGWVVDVAVINESGKEWAHGVTADDDERIEEWATLVRGITTGEAICSVVMRHYSSTELLELHLSITDGAVSRAYAIVDDDPDIELERLAELSTTLLPGRLLVDCVHTEEIDDETAGQPGF